MVTISPSSKDRANRRARTVAIGLDQLVQQQTSRTRNAMILLAMVMLGVAVATHAFAAGSGAMNGMGYGTGSGFGGHVGGFRGPVLDQAPSTPAPTFNSSSPYTVPQTPETPVSPGSPGSVFGNG
jgi:hypothetical protein